MTSELRNPSSGLGISGCECEGEGQGYLISLRSEILEMGLWDMALKDKALELGIQSFWLRVFEGRHNGTPKLRDPSSRSRLELNIMGKFFSCIMDAKGPKV